MNKKTRNILVAILVIVLIASIYFYLNKSSQNKPEPSSDVPEKSDSYISIPVVPSSSEEVTESSSSLIEISSSEEPVSSSEEPVPNEPVEEKLDEDGYYYSKDDVALYLHTYGKLPSNFITKSQARKLGWSGGSVEKYKKGAAIGGDVYGNYEGRLPKNKKYYECDINTNDKKSRGAERIIYTKDGIIYYTDDHYESFTLLYGGK